ncbi:MAG TPA: DUF418 domain-containing protein, partial [Chondromyces sp.]|nr:DUF418 domain-containing protein [Chondromyces sp.]
KVKTILVWAFSLLLLIHILMSVQLFLPSSVLIEVQEKITEKNTGKLEEYVEVYENANYMEWVSYRLEAEILPILANAPFVMFSVLAMFLFGLFAGKIGAFKSDTTHLRLIRQTQKWSLVLAIPFIVLLFLLKTGAVEWGIKTAPAIQLFTSLSGITLCFFYITSLALLLRNQKWQRRLRPLGYTGQMALTNYLLQTIICIILFLGFGLYGKVSLAAGTAIALLIYALQMIFSYLWMKKFSFGPFEWLWRAITYGKFQPLKKRTQGGTNENDQDQSAG